MRFVALILVALETSVALAAQHLLPTKALIVRQNPVTSRYSGVWKVRESGSAATVVGDPTQVGAFLRITLTPGGDACLFLNPANWSVSNGGFRYRESTRSRAIIKTTASGFYLVVLWRGNPPVAPGNPTISYETNFALGAFGAGDEYCGGTATAAPDRNDAAIFKVSDDGAPVGCVASCAPELCGNAQAPQCNGACPNFEYCAPYDEFSTDCLCHPNASPPTCGSAAAPSCGGECAVGQACSQMDDYSGAFTCMCHDDSLPACGGAAAPSCNGACPPGKACKNAGYDCFCTDDNSVACGDDAYPTCGGACPANHHCEAFDPDLQPCFCAENPPF